MDVIEDGKVRRILTASERADAAWRLVLAGGFSKKEISEATGVSAGLVATMRRTAKKLGPDATQYVRWKAARQASSVGSPTP